MLSAFAFAYLAVLALCLAMNRHHKALFTGEPSPLRRQLLRLVALPLMALSLALCIRDADVELGILFWLALLMLATLALVLTLAWRQRWAMPLAGLLLVSSALTHLG